MLFGLKRNAIVGLLLAMNLASTTVLADCCKVCGASSPVGFNTRADWECFNTCYITYCFVPYTNSEGCGGYDCSGGGFNDDCNYYLPCA